MKLTSIRMVALGAAILCLGSCKANKQQAAPPTVTATADPVPVAAKEQPSPPVDPAEEEAQAPLPPLAEVNPAPGPLKVVPKIVIDPGPSMMDHPHIIGWSKDSMTFGYCVQNGGSGCLVCELKPLEGKARRLSDCSGEGDPSKAAHRRLKAKLRKIGLGQRGKVWPFGGDLEVHRPANKGVVGARLRGDTKGHYPLRLPEYDDAAVMVEAVAVSPDGKQLGVLGHTFAGEFTDTYPLRVVSSAALAASTYNTAGYARHKKGKYIEAAELFAKAAAADPKHPHALYNRACALARAGKPQARTALARSIERDGDAAREKAKEDKDFESVKDEPWFRRLTTTSDPR